MLTLAAVVLTVLAGAPVELQPKTYTSPSGRWSLRVEPEERSGTKGAEYVLTGGERETWRKTLAFALWDAVVTDEGRVAGYAYSGAEIDAAKGGALRVVVLSPAGDVLLDEAHERVYSHFEHGSASPRAIGLFAQPELGRFVVRATDESIDGGAEAWWAAETWWAYDCASGKRLSQESPRTKLAAEEPLKSLLAGRALPGTPLVLLQWWRTDYEREPCQLGTLFQLVDPAWNVVWSLALPHDYESEDDEARDRLRDEMWEHGAVLATAPQRFELRLMAEEARVTFGVERVGEAWKVSELARVPFQENAAAAAPEMPTRTLTLSRRVPLGAPPAPGVEIRDIEAFGFDERSHVRFVRREGDEGAVTLVKLDASGSVLRAKPVAAREGEARSEWYPLPGERWLAVSETYDEKPAHLRLVRESDGSASEVPGFSGQDVNRIAALGPDSFVLLGSWNSRYTMTSGLVAFDLAGQVLWTVDEDMEEGLFSPEDVAVTDDGRVVVLENIRNVLQVYSAKGAYLQTVELEPLWGHEPNYPSGIHADREGGVLVHDFGGQPPLYRLTREFALAASFGARLADGTALDDYPRNAQVAPDGRLWTTDGHEFLRLDDAGLVDLQLGSAERVDELADPGFACVESLFGRILIHDRRSRAVHVFDGEGQLVTLCTPKPEEREKLDYPMALAVAPDGSVYVADSQHDARALHFRPDGSSAGFENMRAANLAFASTGDSLGVRGARVERLSAAGKALGSLDKRPDGQWFRAIEDLALAADGALAVLEMPASEGGLRRGPGDGCVVLFDPQGKPLKSYPFPGEVRAQELAYVGQRVLLKDWQRAWLMDTRDGSLVALSLAEPAHAFGLSPDGRELWAVAKDGRSLLRYALEP